MVVRKLEPKREWETIEEYIERSEAFHELIEADGEALQAVRDRIEEELRG